MSIYYETLKGTLVSESKLDDAIRKYGLNYAGASFLKDVDPLHKFQNKYTDWVAKHLNVVDDLTRELIQDSAGGIAPKQIYDLLATFKQTGRNINDFHSFGELAKFIESKRSVQRQKIYAGVNKNDAEVIYVNPNKSEVLERIVWLKTFKGASTLYRGDTHWCITKNIKHWEDFWNRSFGFLVFETNLEPPYDFIAYQFRVFDHDDPENELWNSENQTAEEDLHTYEVVDPFRGRIPWGKIDSSDIYDGMLNTDEWFYAVNHFLYSPDEEHLEDIKRMLDENPEYATAQSPEYTIKMTALSFIAQARVESDDEEMSSIITLLDLLMHDHEGFVRADIQNSIEKGVQGWEEMKKAGMVSPQVAYEIEKRSHDLRTESASIYGMVLQESRLDKAVEKYNLNSDQRHFIYSIDPNSRLQNRYTEWLAKHVKELWETDTAEDIYQTLLMFQTMGRKISEFSSWKEVVEFVNSKRGMVRKNIYADKKRDYAEIVDGNSKYRLLWIKNFTGMHALYGGNADWCVANNEQFWDEYTRHGEKFFLVLECQKCDVWDENLVMMNSPYAILINPGDAENIDVLVQTYHVWDSNNSSNIDDPENDPVFSFNQDDMIAINDIMRKNREKIMKIAKKISMRESASVYGMLLQEGRAGGYIHHPYEFVHTGAELISLFKRLAMNFSDPQYLKQHVSLKVDGVNAVFKLVHRNGGVQWAFDGGSGKGEDVRGVATDELHARFGEHRPIYFQAINTLNRMLPYIGSNLRELGLEAENQKGLMCDINMPGTTNVVDYATQFPFLTIHDVVHMQDKPESKRGAREAVEVPVDATLLKKTVNLMDGLAQKRGWRIFGGVGVVLATETLDVSVPLKRKISIGNETKALEKWIEGITIDHKQVNLKNYTKMLHHEQMTAPEHEGALIFLANMLCGQHILNSLKSAVLSPSEGIVIRDSQIANGKMKITGNFMVNRSKSPFNKKELK